ncbi:MAG: hypothetical protein WC831_02260 [Parcubacteria group bacterium]|jgi:hypothetical protein
MPTNYLEPIEKEDVDLKGKFTGQRESAVPSPEKNLIKEEKIATIETPGKKEIEPAGPEKETGAEVQEEKISEKIETARKTISTHKPGTAAAITDDAKTIAGITEYEKKVEKLVELALQKGPEHAIKVAQHMDSNDNYTLDELHDRMIEDDLRKQLVQKGMLKDL